MISTGTIMINSKKTNARKGKLLVKQNAEAMANRFFSFFASLMGAVQLLLFGSERWRERKIENIHARRCR